MKVKDFFQIGEKTIFVGELETNESSIVNEECTLSIAGKNIKKIKIDGEVLNNTGHRDLWTLSQVHLNHNTLKNQEVWLTNEYE
jgi:hypothetical protein